MDTEEGVSYGDRFKAYRTRHGIPQSELARRLGGPVIRTIARIENGKSYPARRLREAFDALENNENAATDPVPTPPTLADLPCLHDLDPQLAATISQIRKLSDLRAILDSRLSQLQSQARERHQALLRQKERHHD